MEAKNRYRNLLPVLINGEYGQGDEFDADPPLSPEDEEENVASGLIEILPREWRNITPDTRVYDTAPGETFTAVLTLGQQKHLLDGGFIEPVEVDEPEPKPAAKKPSTRKRKG